MTISISETRGLKLIRDIDNIEELDEALHEAQNNISECEEKTTELINQLKHWMSTYQRAVSRLDVIVKHKTKLIKGETSEI